MKGPSPTGRLYWGSEGNPRVVAMDDFDSFDVEFGGNPPKSYDNAGFIGIELMSDSKLEDKIKNL